MTMYASIRQIKHVCLSDNCKSKIKGNTLVPLLQISSTFYYIPDNNNY